MSTTAAFYDYDKTMISIDSSELECKFVMLKKIPCNISCFCGLFQSGVLDLLVKLGWCSTKRINEAYVSSYKGTSLAHLEISAKDLYHSKIKHCVYPEMIESMKRHREKGHLVILVSAASEHLLKPFSEDCQADIWEATKIQTDDGGICTGCVQGNVCCEQQKVEVMKRLSKQYGIDLENSYAYSDHHSDLPFLEAVGNPVVVNPTNILEKVAWERKWQVKRCKQIS